MISLMLYSLSSITVSAVVILYAFATRMRFYPTVVFLFTSKFASVSIINLAIVFAILLGVGCTRLFLGRLRDAETEAVWENMRFSVTETAFALTTFRDELNAKVGALFAIMLFAKVFHVLNEARVEHIEQSNQTTWLVHARMIGLSITLFLLNSAVYFGCLMHLSTYGPSVYLLFAFEHAVLLVTLSATICRYGMAVYDLHYVQGRWQNKSQWEMYVALLSDALQFTAYMLFAGVVFAYYGVPIHLMRSLYMTFRNLMERLNHFIKFRRILNSLNERFPDATEEELAATDRVCIICREDMEVGGGASGVPKKLQCNHYFHSYCLQNWLERQFSCPTCRRPIPEAGQQQAQNAAAAPPAAANVVPPVVVAGQQNAAEINNVVPPQIEQPAQVAGANQANTQEEVRRDDAERTRRAAAIAQRLQQIPASTKEEEETADDDEKRSNVVSSPPMRKNKDLDGGAVLFRDRSFEPSPFVSFIEEQNQNRTELLELELKVYQAQLAVARESQEFALKVLRIQQGQQQKQ